MIVRAMIAFLLAAATVPAQRVLLISLDGFGYRALTEDAATREMPALRGVIARGVARPVQPAFPSTTANGHIALATGAWADVNGKHANSHPVLPRRDHTSFERGNGFRAEGLTAEPVWVTAARAGLRSAAVNFVPTYPFLPSNAPAGLPLTVINHYQTRRAAGNRLLTEKDVTPEACEGWKPKGSKRPPRCFTWREDALVFHAALGASTAKAYDFIEVATGVTGARVRADARPLENAPPLARALARHFSSGLRLTSPFDAVVYFRLFEIAADGSSFALLRTAVEELGVFDTNEAMLRRRLLAEAGGVIGNSRSPFAPETDDTRLGRSLELAELVIRQLGRTQERVWRNAKPRLQMGYFSYPDEADHNWLGLAATQPRFAEARRWIYIALDAALKPIVQSVAANDHVIFVSDHGMAAVTKQVRVYLPLARAGLVAQTAKGQLDARASKVSLLYNCLLVNTRDWKGGIVPLGERETVMATAARVLRETRDPATGQGVFPSFYPAEKFNAELGMGGEAGADLCFDVAPGYTISATFDGPVVANAPQPRGQHGYYPLREDMQSIFIGAGPRLRIPGGGPMLRAIDVATLVTDLLGIPPPAQAKGRSPLQSQ